MSLKKRPSSARGTKSEEELAAMKIRNQFLGCAVVALADTKVDDSLRADVGASRRMSAVLGTIVISTCPNRALAPELLGVAFSSLRG